MNHIVDDCAQITILNRQGMKRNTDSSLIKYNGPIVDWLRKSHNAPASSAHVVISCNKHWAQFIAYPWGVSPIKCRLSRNPHPLPRGGSQKAGLRQLLDYVGRRVPSLKT